MNNKHAPSLMERNLGRKINFPPRGIPFGSPIPMDDMTPDDDNLARNAYVIGVNTIKVLARKKINFYHHGLTPKSALNQAREGSTT
jgi:hypothetical protein